MNDSLKSINNFLREARLEAGNRDYAASLASAEKASPLLDTLSLDSTPSAKYHDAWGGYFQQKLKCLRQLQMTDALSATCHAVLDRFPIDEEDCANEHPITLQVARRASRELATLALERRDADAAVEWMERCFALTASNDEVDDPFVSSYVLRAIVFLAGYRSEPDRYQIRFFESLDELTFKARKFPEIRIDDPELVAFLEDPAYLAYQASKPAEVLSKGGPGETWEGALDRFRAFAEELQIAQQSPLADSVFEIGVWPVALSDLMTHEKDWDCMAPAALRELYLDHGSFKVQDEWGALTLYGHGEDGLRLFGGIVHMIDQLWGGRPEFDNDFSEDEIAFLNANFFVFGQFCHDSNVYTHLFFDRDGRFGSVRYDQDEWGPMETALRHMIDGRQACFQSLDELISEQMNAVIEYLIYLDDEARMEG